MNKEKETLSKQLHDLKMIRIMSVNPSFVELRLSETEATVFKSKPRP